MSSVVDKTRKYVKELFKNDHSGHDIEHTENVVKNALDICEVEQKGDREIVELAALLHDINDWKAVEKREKSAGEEASDWLTGIGCDKRIIKEVKEIIDGVTYYGPQSEDRELSFEGEAVRDADRLEAMGERAVERTREFGKANGIPEFNEYMPNLNLSVEEYSDFKRKENSFVNHFFEKLLLLNNKLQTRGGKSVGFVKQGYMKEYMRDYLTEHKLLHPEKQEQIEKLLELLDSKRYD